MKTKIKVFGFEAKEVGVDSGLIMIADIRYFDAYGGIKTDGINKDNLFQIEQKGAYSSKWKIKETYNGPIAGEDDLYVDSGKIVVTDPCYVVHDDKWEKFLEEHFVTIRGQYRMIRPMGAVLIDRMGGDGSYNVKWEVNYKAF